MSERVYIGLGSNLDNPQQQIRRAIEALKNLPETEYVKSSGLYRSKPMATDSQSEEQPEYYNAVVLIKTALEPLLLLDHLQTIEHNQGRLRVARWGPRTIDLDILLYGQQLIRKDRLQVPHPGMCEREFVLYPLQQIEPDLNIPGHGIVEDVIKACPENGMQYVGVIK